MSISRGCRSMGRMSTAVHRYFSSFAFGEPQKIPALHFYQLKPSKLYRYLRGINYPSWENTFSKSRSHGCGSMARMSYFGHPHQSFLHSVNQKYFLCSPSPIHTLQNLIHILDISNIEADKVVFRRVEASGSELSISQ